MKRTCQLVTVTLALFYASACTDDDEREAVGDAAADAASADASASDAGAQDGGFVGMDAAARADAAVLLDATVDAHAQQADAASVADAQRAPGPTADASVAPGSGLDGGAAIEVQGRYMSNFGELEVIDATQWGFTKLIEFDNATRVAVTQNPATDMFNPSKFNRYVWTPKSQDGSFYYCTVDYGLQTVELARSSTKVADATSPMTAGCGGFAWTKLTPAP